MDGKEFREFGKAAVDYIADYVENIRDRDVLPAVEPGYLRHLMPQDAPEQPEPWADVLADVEKVVMPGMTHWQSPHFHAYYPTASSYPSVVGEMLAAAIGCMGFSWMSSPVCTELEMSVTDWLGRLMALPSEYLHSEPGPGGGIIQGSASEATLVCLLAAKERAVRRAVGEHPGWTEGEVKTRLVAYSSDQSNSSVEKAGLLASVPMRLLLSDDACRLSGATLETAILADLDKGLIPCYVVATFGTTGTCAFDDLPELAEVCTRHDVWLHVDAAYAGAALVCPELRPLMPGIELADSFDVNPHKWLLVNFDCSVMWVKDHRYLNDALNVDRIYLKHNKQDLGLVPEFRHWQIPLGRRFRALKLWLVMRLYGAQGLRAHIRRHLELAEQLETLLRADSRFELPAKPALGLLCFRLRGPDTRTRSLLERLTARRRLYMVAATVRGEFVIRFAVCSHLTEARDIDFAWEEILSQTDACLEDESLQTPTEGVPLTTNGHSTSQDHRSTSCVAKTVVSDSNFAQKLATLKKQFVSG